MVRPLLLDKLNQSFPDPSQFKKEEEFVYAAKTASIFKKVIAELIAELESYKAQAEKLRNKAKGEVNNFEIGR